LVIINPLPRELCDGDSIVDTMGLATNTWQLSNMKKSRKQVIREFLQKAGSKGGKARAAKHDKATLSRWAQKGGKPRNGHASKQVTHK
jgi:hypothetical protein